MYHRYLSFFQYTNTKFRMMKNIALCFAILFMVVCYAQAMETKEEVKYVHFMHKNNHD